MRRWVTGVRRGVRWSSLLLVVACCAVALVCAVAALRGRPWALVPGLVAAAVALREVRTLRRGPGRAGTR